MENKEVKSPVAYYPEKVEFYKDAFKQWRWRIKSDNGNVIGASTEGYKNKKDAIYNYCSVGLTIVESGQFEIYFNRLLNKMQEKRWDEIGG